MVLFFYYRGGGSFAKMSINETCIRIAALPNTCYHWVFIIHAAAPVLCSAHNIIRDCPFWTQGDSLRKHFAEYITHMRIDESTILTTNPYQYMTAEECALVLAHKPELRPDIIPSTDGKRRALVTNRLLSTKTIIDEIFMLVSHECMGAYLYTNDEYQKPIHIYFDKRSSDANTTIIPEFSDRKFISNQLTISFEHNYGIAIIIGKNNTQDIHITPLRKGEGKQMITEDPLWFITVIIY
jgi:hypothetical protein